MLSRGLFMPFTKCKTKITLKYAARRRLNIAAVVDFPWLGGVAELAYAMDLKSMAFGIEGSSPSAPTIFINPNDGRPSMKKIVIACGAGAATSTLVAQKIADLLDSNDYAGKYEIEQCAISEAKDNCDDADLLIATTIAPEGLKCAYVSGVPFMTGIGLPAARQAVLDEMAK